MIIGVPTEVKDSEKRIALTSGAAGPVEVLQSLPLSGGYTLHIVRVGERTLAVTCGPGGVAVTDAALPPADDIEEPSP